MSLSKDFAAALVKPVRCHTCKALASLPPADRDALQAAINNRDLSVRVVVDVCLKNGVQVGKNSIDAHRQGRCPRP
jgi:hypothetical protein